ncbi:MAG: hypothetical protein VR65_05970 [Desulfobulbaceae bacterium BRH_c16a]|nr:MAG: hypothetical protein VR65_05970 [Desulfobulbaceae bacterium BRH_c16a]
MKTINIHKRTIGQSIGVISDILNTLSSNDDKLWPKEKWPPMIFRKGLTVGAIGGHGPIKYSINTYIPGSSIEFTFVKPDGFKGVHRFEVTEIENNKTELKHTIDMMLSRKGILTWHIAIRWLHDALIEDCFDKVENQFSTNIKETKWNFWVVFLRNRLRKYN